MKSRNFSSLRSYFISSHGDESEYETSPPSVCVWGGGQVYGHYFLMGEEGENLSTTQSRGKCRFVLFEVFRIPLRGWRGCWREWGGRGKEGTFGEQEQVCAFTPGLRNGLCPLAPDACVAKWHSTWNRLSGPIF